MLNKKLLIKLNLLMYAGAIVPLVKSILDFKIQDPYGNSSNLGNIKFCSKIAIKAKKAKSVFEFN